MGEDMTEENLIAVREDDELITIKEVAEILGYSVNHAREKIKGISPVIPIKRIDSGVSPAYYSKQEILAFNDFEKENHETEKINNSAITLAESKDERIIATTFYKQQIDKFEDVDDDFKKEIIDSFAKTLNTLERVDKARKEKRIAEEQREKAFENERKALEREKLALAEKEKALIIKEELEEKEKEYQVVNGERILKKELQAKIVKEVRHLSFVYNLEQREVWHFLYDKFILQHPYVYFKEEKERLKYLVQNGYGRDLYRILLQSDFIPNAVKEKQPLLRRKL